MLRVMFAAAIVAACSCASGQNPSPQPERINRVNVQSAGRLQIFNDPGVGSRTVPAPVDSVWQVMPAVFTQLDIPEHGVDPQHRMYGNPSFRASRVEGKRLSSYIDCGMGATATPNADQYQVTMAVLATLTASGDTATVVTTTVDATGRPRSVSGNPVHCQSKGVLEMRVAQLVMFELVRE